MSKKWYSMKANNKDIEMSIYADIGMWGISAGDFRKELKLNNVTKESNLTVKINTYGGEVFDGNAIKNDLEDTGANITMVVTGVCASIGTVILMAASKGKIKIHRNAMLMIHNPSVGMWGEAKDLEREAEVLKQLKESAITSYQKHSSLSREQLSKMMDETTWMTAEEAVKNGFANEILDPIEIDEPETNSSVSIPINYRKSIFTNKIPAGSEPAHKEVTMKCPKCGKHDILEGQTMCLECARAQERAEATAAEQNRIVAINDLCSVSGLSQEFTNGLIKSGKPIDQITSEITKEIQRMKALPPVPPAASSVHVDKDEADKFRMHAVNTLAVQAGIEKDPTIKNEIRKGEQIGSLHGLMRRDLQRHGVDSVGMNAIQLVENVIRMAGIGSSDLPAILGDLTNKNMEKAYEEAPVTWDRWCRVKEVPNFNSQKLIKMSLFGDIDDLPEGSPYKNKKLTDKYETIKISGKGNIFTVTFEAMVNDDLDAIVTVPRSMVLSFARRQNRDVYDLLVSQSLTGPNIVEDGTALFTTAHGNLKSSSGVPTVTSLGVAERMLMEMPLPKANKDDGTNYSNVPAKYLIAGTANKVTVNQLLKTEFDNSKSVAGVYNPFSESNIEPVFDAYLQSKLTAASRTNAWYLASDPMQMGHIVVAFLQGYRNPTLRNEKSAIGDSRGFTWEISGDSGVGVEDFRGIVYNDGQ